MLFKAHLLISALVPDRLTAQVVQVFWYRQRKPSSASKQRLPRSIRVVARARRLFGECEKFVQKLLDPV